MLGFGFWARILGLTYFLNPRNEVKKTAASSQESSLKKFKKV
jgi:hypothetical protein